MPDILKEDLINQLRKDLISYVKIQESVIVRYDKILNRLWYSFILIGLLVVMGTLIIIFQIQAKTKDLKDIKVNSQQVQLNTEQIRLNKEQIRVNTQRLKDDSIKDANKR